MVTEDEPLSSGLPPGAYGLPLIGETLGWLRDPDAWVRGYLERYGHIFKTSVFGRRVIVMIGPEANQFILQSHRDHFEWSGGYQTFVGGLFPGSLSMSDGEEHDRYRRLLQPEFRGKGVQTHFPLMHERVVAHTEDWAQVGEITAFDGLRRLTFDIVANVLLGPITGDQIRVLSSDFESLSRGVLAPLKWRLPWMAYGRALRARSRLKSWISAAVARARVEPKDDFLGSLIHAQRNGSSSLTDEEISAHVLGLMFDG